jgi:hypothetical protein
VQNEPQTRQRRWTGPLLGLVGLAVLAFVLFRYANTIIAAFIVIVAATVLGMAVVARDWDQHPTYEDREAARARKRKEKWARGQGARAKDRARWEAHRARQAQQADKPAS